MLLLKPRVSDTAHFVSWSWSGSVGVVIEKNTLFSFGHDTICIYSLSGNVAEVIMMNLSSQS